MKRLHTDKFWGWSSFDTERNLDFNSTFCILPSGNVIIDPLPLSLHDRGHIEQLGGAAWVVITNKDHVRDSVAVAKHFGAKVAGPAQEKSAFPVACDLWLDAKSAVIPGLRVLELNGSKTPGELALLVQEKTLITGDLIRGHVGGHLNLLPDPKLKDKAAAQRSVRALLDFPAIDAVIVGDGWPIFRDGTRILSEFISTL